MLECKEGFSFGHEWATDPGDRANALTGANVWPESIDEDDKRALLSWYDACNAISRVIIRAVSKILGFGDNDLDKYFAQSAHEVSLARLFRYFGTSSEAYKSVCPDGQDSACTGSSPHTDWGCLTLVMESPGGAEDTSQGLLQLWNESRYQQVRFERESTTGSGTFLVNFGDYLSLLSNGTFASPLHRVALPSGASPRLSAVFFFYPDFNAAIPPLDSSQGSLSLLQDQSGNGGKCASAMCSSTVGTFGAFIADKWAQVTRKND